MAPLRKKATGFFNFPFSLPLVGFLFLGLCLDSFKGCRFHEMVQTPHTNMDNAPSKKPALSKRAQKLAGENADPKKWTFYSRGLDKENSHLRNGENTSRGTAHFFQVNIGRGWPFENTISGLNNKDVETMRTWMAQLPPCLIGWTAFRTSWNQSVQLMWHYPGQY